MNNLRLNLLKAIHKNVKHSPIPIIPFVEAITSSYMFLPRRIKL